VIKVSYTKFSKVSFSTNHLATNSSHLESLRLSCIHNVFLTKTADVCTNSWSCSPVVVDRRFFVPLPLAGEDPHVGPPRK